MTRLLLAERRAEVEDLLSRGLGAGAVWAALAPAAMHALDARGIPYVIPEDFLPVAEQRRSLLEGHARLERYCRDRDAELWRRRPGLEKAGLRPWLFHFASLALPFDALASRALQLEALLGAHPGAEVVCHRGGARPWGVQGLGFSSGETLFAHLLSLGSAGRRTTLLDAGEAPGAPPAAGGALKRLAGKSLVAGSLLKHLSAGDWGGAASLLVPGRPGLLVLNDPYDWSDAARELAASGFAVYRLSDAMVERAPRDEGLPAPPLPEEHPFRAGGRDFSSLLASRLAWLEAHAGPEAERLAALAGRLARRGRLRAALASTTAGFTGHCLQQGLRAAGVPVAKWQHGFTVAQARIPQFYDFRDMMAADLLLLFGEGSRAAYASALERFPIRLCCAGSSSLDALRPARPPRAAGKRLLYVTTNYNLNNTYCGYEPFFCDRLFYRDQKALLEGVRRLAGRVPGAEAAVKIADEASEDRPPWIAEAAPLEVLDKPGFSALLSRFDAVLIDSPTTTALQAAASGKPMFVLTRHYRYPPDAAAALSRRAVCAETPERLLEGLEAWWRDGDYPSDCADTAFLRGWGNHADDGRSAARAVEAVQGLLGVAAGPA